MDKSNSEQLGRAAGIVNWLVSKTAVAVLLVVAFTAAISIPFITMAPETSASTEPDGPVFEARDEIQERFQSNVYPVFLIAESTDEDFSQKSTLLELEQAQSQIRESDEFSEKLVSYFDTDFETEVSGMFTLVDAVKLQLGVDQIADASQAQIDSAIDELVDRFGVESDKLLLSSQTTRTESGGWQIPAVRVIPLFDNEVLDFPLNSVALGSDTEPEEFARTVQEQFRNSDAFETFGVALDVNLTSQEQGELAGPFIGFTILAVVLIVGLVFRSYWSVAVVGLSFATLIVWLKGISNLIGFEEDLVLSLIVPIAMVSFGVDFAFHSIGRYREMLAEGKVGTEAIGTGLLAVGSALFLALASDSTAFLANTTAGIESIVQFGIGAAIATACAFLLLGYIAPTVIGRLEQKFGYRRTTGIGRVGVIAGIVGSATLTMATVLFLVFIAPVVGLMLLFVNALLTIGIPYLVASRRKREVVFEYSQAESKLGGVLSAVTGVVAQKNIGMTALAVIVTSVAAFFAWQVPVAFDVEDFFSPETDFVQGLDLLDTHVGELAGEPAQVLVVGDLADPGELSKLRAELESFTDQQSEYLATDADGVANDSGIFEVFDSVFESQTALGQIEALTGVEISDADNNGVPDTRPQVEAILETVSETGVPFEGNQLSLTPNDVAVRVDLEGENSATVFEFGVVNSRDLSSVKAAQEDLDSFASAITDQSVGLEAQPTGSSVERGESLTATSSALLVSLPIAIVVCFLIAAGYLRSIRLGLISVAPIVMVVSWLYALMYAMGFSVNLVTATIGAVSVGIGIDFSVHYVVRFVEESDKGASVIDALRKTSSSTGLALAASALSSIVGFAILAFAPMPLFASYGFLTALMIALALLSTFTVLPALLALGKKAQKPTRSFG